MRIGQGIIPGESVFFGDGPVIFGRIAEFPETAVYIALVCIMLLPAIYEILTIPPILLGRRPDPLGEGGSSEECRPASVIYLGRIRDIIRCDPLAVLRVVRIVQRHIGKVCQLFF